MYILKNAVKNIKESKGKSLLIGIIIFVIGLSCTLALSIKEASNTAYENGLKDLNITANISFDRQKMMEEMNPPSGDNGNDSNNDNRSEMKQAMQNQDLSLSELQKYAKASSVKDFYYTETLSMNSNDEMQKIEGSTNSMGGKMGSNNQFNNGDFSLVGYSSYDGMSDFNEGVKKISSGSLFNSSANNECIISQDLATYNSLEVGDSITLINPNNASEKYTLKITGIFNDSDASSQQAQMGNGQSDPANQIYTSTSAIDMITNASQKVTDNQTNGYTLESRVNGTYVFSNVSNYESFKKQVSELGLEDSYVVNSSDITNFENSLIPLNNLSDYANTFLIVILCVGCLILIIFNLLRIKERKYEIGVLSAIGMNKKKISLQFISEILIITIVSLIIAIGVGATTSVPLTNTLLANSDTTSVMEDQMPNDRFNQNNGQTPGNNNSTNKQNPSPTTNYIDSVNSATDLKVILELLGISLVLCILSGGIATLTILRYEPLKILSNRE